jgi:phage terminase large subunit GpA-like protein
MREGVRNFTLAARGTAFRSRLQFAQEVIVIDEGKFKGRWRIETQPYAAHAFHLMDTLGFRKFRAMGCVQSGKTTNLSLINLAWHLYERREDCIVGIPQLKMAENVWSTKIEPLFRKSPELRQILPTTGAGSRGGFSDLIRFRNNATLKFMGGGGSDDERSSHTAPVVLKMEVDKYDTAPGVSREGPPPEQMSNRAESFGDDAFDYEECTVSDETGRINTEVKDGTQTWLYYECPHCREWIRPFRTDFVGIEDCENVRTAQEQGSFKCPKCTALFSEDERKAMTEFERCVPVHSGQAITKGKRGKPIIKGDLPPTDKFSFSWNAFDNRFWSTKHIATGEWRAMYSTKSTEMDKNRKQMAWTEPSTPEEINLTPLTLANLMQRSGGHGHLVAPAATNWMSCGVDVRKTQLHFVVKAWTSTVRDETQIVQGHSVDMGFLDVDSAKLGVRMAVLDALKRFRDKLLEGYHCEDGRLLTPGWTLIDAGWRERIIWEFILDCADNKIRGFMPILGRGQSEPPGKGSYVHPRETNKKVLWIGEECHIRRSSQYEQFFIDSGIADPPMFVMANSDEWKAFTRDGYETPIGQPGALTTFTATTHDEKKLLLEHGKQLLSESERMKVVPRRGSVIVFENASRRPNHYGDCDYYSCVAGNICGVPIAVRDRRRPKRSDQKPTIITPDGSPFVAA